MKWQRESINRMIEDSILEADSKGVRVLSLGLLNQASKALQQDTFASKIISHLYSCHVVQDAGLNENGDLFLRRNPQLKVKLVDGSSLAVAVVLNSIPKGTTRIALRGNLSKVAYAIALALCQGGIQVWRIAILSRMDSIYFVDNMPEITTGLYNTGGRLQETQSKAY